MHFELGAPLDETGPLAGRGLYELAALAEIARIATDPQGLRPTLQRIADSLARLFGWELVALVGIDRQARRFVCEALATELPTEIYVGYSRELGSGVVGQVAESGEPIVVDDADQWQGFVHTLPGARSEICVPVRHHGDIVGIINVESLRAEAFRDQLPLLETVAGQVAGVIASARLLDATEWRARIAESEASVTRLATAPRELEGRLQSIVDDLRERFDFALVALILADAQGREWTHRAISLRPGAEPLERLRWPAGAGIVGRAIRGRTTQLVADVASDPDYVEGVPGVVAELVIPIVIDEQVAAFNFEAETLELFRPEMITFLHGIVDRVASAIGLAVANQRLEESRHQLSETAARLEAANLELRRLTLVDGLTGVANRRCFDERLDEEWRRAIRRHEWLAIALVDIDCFKAYNDALGHRRGDEALTTVARLLAAGASRAGDLVARWGGEEFAVILGAAAPPEAKGTAERLRETVAERRLAHPASTAGDRVTVSIGVAAEQPATGSSPTGLLERADVALYQAKRGGRNRVVLAGE